MLLGFVGLCLLVGGTSAGITATNMRPFYAALARPPGTPPDAAFGPVWTALYVLMAVAAWLVWREADRAVERSYRALRLWGWQLLANAVWVPVFFGLHLVGLALLVALALVAAVGATARAFFPLSRPAAALLVPYLLWSCYAAYLNAGFWWLNGR